jgi:hypothetical protein
VKGFKEKEKKKGFILPYLRGVLYNFSLVYPLINYFVFPLFVQINSLVCLFLRHLRILFLEHQSPSQGKMTRI